MQLSTIRLLKVIASSGASGLERAKPPFGFLIWFQNNYQNQY